MGKARKPNVPGSIYIRGGRYWWDVRLPGERQHRSRPLIPTGADLATSDYNTAVEVARAEYEEALVGHTIRPGQEADVPTGPMTIIELLARYKAHASTYYVDESSTPTQEVQNIDLATRPLREFCPTDLVQDFGPRRLKEVRQYMASKTRTLIVEGQPQEVTRLCRKEINRRINSIRRMFRWGVSEQLVPQGIYYALKALEPLKKGRARVRETKKVRPIEEKWVRLCDDAAVRERRQSERAAGRVSRPG